MPWPRFGINAERLNVITVVPSCFHPRVDTVTTPCVGRDFDSRMSSTVYSA